MVSKARSAYRVFAGLFLVGVFVQVFLAGLGIFAHPSNIKFHMFMGLALHGLSFGMLVLSVYSRQPVQTTRLNGALFLALFVQGALPHLRGIVPAAAALHPMNAIVIFWIALLLARRARVFSWMHRKPGRVHQLAHVIES